MYGNNSDLTIQERRHLEQRKFLERRVVSDRSAKLNGILKAMANKAKCKEKLDDAA